MQKIENYINGQLVPPSGDSYLDNYEPATGQVYSLIPQSDEHDLALAVSAAEQAKVEWAQMPAEQRSNLLLKLADAIDAASDELARAEAIDNGKPIMFTINSVIFYYFYFTCYCCHILSLSFISCWLGS